MVPETCQLVSSELVIINIGLFKFCNIRRMQHVISHYTMEIVHPIQMYLCYLLLIFKRIMDLVLRCQKKHQTVLSSSPYYLIYFVRPCSVMFGIITVLNLFISLLNLSQSSLNSNNHATTVWTKSRPPVQQLLQPATDLNTTQKPRFLLSRISPPKTHTPPPPPHSL